MDQVSNTLVERNTILGHRITLHRSLATNLPGKRMLPWCSPAVLYGGFCVGIASLSLPVYLGETIQAEVRGTLGPLNQLLLVIQEF